MILNPGEYINKNRKKLKMTQKELGEKIDVTQELISLWENNKKRPGYEKVKILSSVLEVSLVEIAEIMGYSRYYDYNNRAMENFPLISNIKEEENLNLTPSNIISTNEQMDKIIEKIGDLERKIDFIDKITVKISGDGANLKAPDFPPASLKMEPNINMIPIIEGRAACGHPSVITSDMADDYLPFPFIPADFIITAKGNSMIEEGITDGMLCFIKRQNICNSGDLVLLNIYENDEAKLIIKKARTVQNIMVYQDGKGNILEIPGDGKIEIIGKIVYKADDPRKFF